jgi:hypothetical protein
MALVSKKFLPRFAVPISAKLFGKSKTWRGFIIMPLATLPSLYLSWALYKNLPLSWQLLNFEQIPLWILGLTLGVAYALFELPNSYLKRRLKIPEGVQATGFWQPIFFILDHYDSLSGIALVYYFLLAPPTGVMIGLLTLAPLIHIVTNLILYSKNLRKNPF